MNQTVEPLIRQLKEDLKKENIMNISESQDFFLNYELGAKLGEGGSGIVKLATHIKTQKDFAVKIINTPDEENVQNIINEFKLVRHLNHPQIVQAYELFIDYQQEKVYYVMELIQGKTLHKFAKQNIKNQYFFEEKICKLIKSLLEVVKYMHKNYICHRDLNPNNLFVVENDTKIKIVDFGVSRQFAKQSLQLYKDIDKQLMYTDTGMHSYKAPELKSQCGYTKKVDLWTIGIICYSVLTGNHPFQEIIQYDDDFDKIDEATIDFSEEVFPYINVSKDFIQRLLKFDPKKRLTASKALKHPWFTVLQQFKINLEFQEFTKKYDKYIQKKVTFNQKHLIRNLSQTPILIQNNQDYIEDYNQNQNNYNEILQKDLEASFFFKTDSIEQNQSQKRDLMQSEFLGNKDFNCTHYEFNSILKKKKKIKYLYDDTQIKQKIYKKNKKQIILQLKMLKRISVI